MGPIGEAFVRVHADTRPMKGEVERGTKSAFAGVRKTLIGLGAGIGGFEFLKHAITDAAETQRAIDSLQQAVTSSGAAWKTNGVTVEDQLKKMRELSGASLPELSQGFLRLVTATQDSAKSLKDLKLAEDVSIARKIGLAQASVILARAEGGSGTALRRLGIIIPPVTAHYDSLKKRVENAVASGVKFSKAQQLVIKTHLDEAKALDKTATTQKIFATLQQRFGGQTERFGKTAAGAYARLRGTIRGVMEEIGGALLPGLTHAAQSTQAWLEQLRQSPKFVGGLKSAVSSLGDIFHMAAGIVQSVLPPLAAVATAATTLAKAIGAPAIIAAIATYKALGIATGLYATAQAKLNQVQAAGAAETAAMSGAQAEETGSTVALTTALEANTAATLANAEAMGTQGVAAIERWGAAAGGAGVASRTAATEVETLGARAATTGTKMSTFGAGLLALSGGTKTLALIGVAGLIGAVVYLATREGEWEGATRRAAIAIDQLSSSMNHAKTLVQDLAHAKLDVAMAKTARETAKLQVEQDKATIAQFKGNKKSLEFRQLLNNLTRDQQAYKASVLGVTDAVNHQNQVHAEQVKTNKEIEANRTKAVGQLTHLKQITDKNNASIAYAFKTTQSQGVSAKDRAQRDATLALIQQRNLKKFIDGLNELQRAQVKTGKDPGISHNLTLLKQFATALEAVAPGKTPTKREIRIALQNKDAKLSLSGFLDELRGLGDRGAKAIVDKRSKIHQAGLILGHDLADGMTEGITSRLAGIAAAAQTMATVAILAAKFAAATASPSKKTMAIGADLGKGFLVGIESQSAALKSTATKFVDGFFGPSNDFKRKGGKWFLRGLHDMIPVPQQGSLLSKNFFGTSGASGDQAGILRGQGFSTAASLLAARWWEKNAPSIISNARAFGAKVTQGLAQGMMTEDEALRRSAADSGAHILASIKKTLGITSPSKEAAKIGVDFNMGLIVGMQGTKQKVQIAAVQSVTSAVNSALNASSNSGVAAALSSGLGDVFASAFKSNQVTNTISDAVKQSIQTVIDSVNSAKNSLSSIGSSIASSINDVIDKRFANQQDQLGKVPAGLKKRFEAIRAQIKAGDTSPELARQAQRLAKEIQASQATATTANSQALDKKKASIERQINDAVTLFNLGKISFKQLQTRVNRQLTRAGLVSEAPISGPHSERSAPGRTQVFTGQGITVTEQLRELIGALHDQAVALRQGPRVPGAGFAPAIVKPLETLRQEQRNIAQAARDQRDSLISATAAIETNTKKAATAAAKTEKHTHATAKATQAMADIFGGKGKSGTKATGPTKAGESAGHRTGGP